MCGRITTEALVGSNHHKHDAMSSGTVTGMEDFKVYSNVATPVLAQKVEVLDAGI